jgi:hypothetical protein
VEEKGKRECFGSLKICSMSWKKSIRQIPLKRIMNWIKTSRAQGLLIMGYLLLHIPKSLKRYLKGRKSLKSMHLFFKFSASI